MTLRVSGGVDGVAARLEDIDALVAALLLAAGGCAGAAAAVARVSVQPGLLQGVADEPDVVLAVVDRLAAGGAHLVRAAGELCRLAALAAAAATVYRAREAALEAAVRGVPLAAGGRLRAAATTGVGLAAADPLLRAALVGSAVVLAGGTAVVLGGGATAAGPGRSPVADRADGASDDRADGAVAGWADGAVDRVVDGVIARPGLVDLAVRAAPGLLGVPRVSHAAAVVATGGTVTGGLRDGPVSVERLPGPEDCTTSGATGAGRAAGGVADLLRRGQGVASWRAPAPGGFDSLPPGSPRPAKGQVRIDRVDGAGGEVAWVVHVPGTQEWDGDGQGSPMDLTANVSLVAGRSAAVSDGVARALVDAGVRPGQPVAVVGHSQGGMTALDLAADPGLRRVATVTHVVTAGSPLVGRPPLPGVQVLALEHDDDLVPRLDGAEPPDTADVVVVRAPSPDGPWRTDRVPAHSSAAYVATAEQVDSSAAPSLVAARAGLAVFLDRPGAVCTTQQYVLTRVRTGSRRPPA